jgi:hypothetical protein
MPIGEMDSPSSLNRGPRWDEVAQAAHAAGAVTFLLHLDQRMAIHHAWASNRTRRRRTPPEISPGSTRSWTLMRHPASGLRGHQYPPASEGRGDSLEGKLCPSTVEDHRRAAGRHTGKRGLVGGNHRGRWPSLANPSTDQLPLIYPAGRVRSDGPG